MNKAKSNPPKLTPLKEQALRALAGAEHRMLTQTRAGSGRRRLMQMKIAEARREYRLGRYVKAANMARTAHL